MKADPIPGSAPLFANNTLQKIAALKLPPAFTRGRD